MPRGTNVNLGGVYIDFLARNQQFIRSIEQNRAALRRARDDARRFRMSINAVRRDARELVRGLGRLAFAFAALAGGASLGRAVSNFADFEAALVRIRALVGISGQSVLGFRNAIEGLGGSLGRTPTQLAEGLFFLTSAGLRGSEALDALRQSAMASSIGIGDMISVANGLTSAMGAYRASALSAEDATDVLVNTVRLGKFPPEQLASQIGRVSASAAALNVEFHELAGLMAFLSRSQELPLAVTRIQAIFRTLLKPSELARDALRQAGLTARQLSQIASEDLGKALFLLRERLDAARVPIATLFRDTQGLNALLQITSGSADEFRFIMDEMRRSTGRTAEGFRITADTLQFRFNRAMGDLQLLMIQVGDSLENSITPALEALRDNFEAATRFASILLGQTIAAVVWRRIGRSVAQVAIQLGFLRSVLVGASVAAQALSAFFVSAVAIESVIVVAQNWERVRGATANAADAARNYFSAVDDGGEAVRELRRDVEALRNAFSGGLFTGVVFEVPRTFLNVLSDIVNTLNESIAAIARIFVQGLIALGGFFERFNAFFGQEPEHLARQMELLRGLLVRLEFPRVDFSALILGAREARDAVREIFSVDPDDELPSDFIDTRPIERLMAPGVEQFEDTLRSLRVEFRNIQAELVPISQQLLQAEGRRTRIIERQAQARARGLRTAEGIATFDRVAGRFQEDRLSRERELLQLQERARRLDALLLNLQDLATSGAEDHLNTQQRIAAEQAGLNLVRNETLVLDDTIKEALEARFQVMRQIEDAQRRLRDATDDERRSLEEVLRRTLEVNRANRQRLADRPVDVVPQFVDTGDIARSIAEQTRLTRQEIQNRRALSSLLGLENEELRRAQALREQLNRFTNEQVSLQNQLLVGQQRLRFLQAAQGRAVESGTQRQVVALSAQIASERQSLSVLQQRLAGLREQEASIRLLAQGYAAAAAELARIERLQRPLEEISQSLAQSFADVALNIKRASDVGREFLRVLVRIATQALVIEPLRAGLQSFIGGFIPGLQAGGLGRGLTLVGERGPELVDFRNPGRVYSNEDLGQALGGGSGSIVINFSPVIQSSDPTAIRRALVEALPLFEDTVKRSVVRDGNRRSQIRRTFRS